MCFANFNVTIVENLFLACEKKTKKQARIKKNGTKIKKKRLEKKELGGKRKRKGQKEKKGKKEGRK